MNIKKMGLVFFLSGVSMASMNAMDCMQRNTSVKEHSDYSFWRHVIFLKACLNYLDYKNMSSLGHNIRMEELSLSKEIAGRAKLHGSSWYNVADDKASQESELATYISYQGLDLAKEVAQEERLPKTSTLIIIEHRTKEIFSDQNAYVRTLALFVYKKLVKQGLAINDAKIAIEQGLKDKVPGIKIAAIDAFNALKEQLEKKTIPWGDSWPTPSEQTAIHDL